MFEKNKDETFVTQRKLFEGGKSLFAKYQDLIIGRKSLLYFLKYELIILFTSWLPGALGLFMRGKLYPLLFGKVGKRVIFGVNIVVRHPHKIFLGNNVVIDDNCVLDAKGNTNKGIFISDRVFIGRNTILCCKDGDIFLAENTLIGFNCEIFSASFVKIGRNSQIAAYSYLNGGTHDLDRTDIPIIEQPRSGRGIVLEDNVWLAANVKVLDGVAIGRDSVIGAGAVVSRDIPCFSIAAGNPARVLRSRS